MGFLLQGQRDLSCAQGVPGYFETLVAPFGVFCRGLFVICSIDVVYVFLILNLFDMMFFKYFCSASYIFQLMLFSFRVFLYHFSCFILYVVVFRHYFMYTLFVHEKIFDV